MKSKVYFTKEINEESLIKMYKILNKELPGNIGVKISTGEKGGNNYLKPGLIKGIVQKLHGTIIECNTAYNGMRMTTEDHLKVAEEHGFTKIANVDIMDSEGEIAISVEDGKHLKENYVGSHLANYDSILMLSHFKGHAMGGFGGALKNMSIGIASSSGKAFIHSAGKTKNINKVWNNLSEQNSFLESMVEADKSVIDYMQGNIIYINVMNNLSVDCDCDSNPEEPCMKDIGILSSLDPVALDEACLDLIYNSSDNGRNHMIERIERQNGRYITTYAEKMHIGTKKYELISIDNN
ncbi:MAG: DUF362 domain-containing protein [Bacilli bacterium]